MSKLPKICLLLCILASSLFAESKIHSTFDGWPITWKDTYLRFEAFIQDREKYWGHYDLEFLEDGQGLYFARYIGEERRVGLQVEANYAGRYLISTKDCRLKLPTEYFEHFNSMKISATLKLGTELGYQYGLPVVWYEITPKKGARRSNAELSTEGYSYRKLELDGEDTKLYPNNRILLFYDYHILPGGHPWDIYGENQRISPNIHITVDNQGLIERNVLEDESAERLLRWVVYKDGELIVDRPVEGEVAFTPDTVPASYVAFVSVMGPSGYMPVSNVLLYPLFPTTSGSSSLWPEDKNRNNTLDVISLKIGDPNALEAKDKFWIEMLYDTWVYNIYTFRMKTPLKFGWKEAPAATSSPIPPPYDFTCHINESGNYVFTWRSQHPEGNASIQIEEPQRSGNWNDLVTFNYSQLAPPVDRNEFTVTLDEGLQLLSFEPPERGSRSRPSDKNFRLSEHRPFEETP